MIIGSFQAEANIRFDTSQIDFLYKQLIKVAGFPKECHLKFWFVADSLEEGIIHGKIARPSCSDILHLYELNDDDIYCKLDIVKWNRLYWQYTNASEIITDQEVEDCFYNVDDTYAEVITPYIPNGTYQYHIGRAIRRNNIISGMLYNLDLFEGEAKEFLRQALADAVQVAHDTLHWSLEQCAPNEDKDRLIQDLAQDYCMVYFFRFLYFDMISGTKQNKAEMQKCLQLEFDFEHLAEINKDFQNQVNKLINPKLRLEDKTYDTFDRAVDIYRKAFIQ